VECPNDIAANAECIVKRGQVEVQEMLQAGNGRLGGAHPVAIYLPMADIDQHCLAIVIDGINTTF
jgi:hypothetical protein